jgi:hypothetical protein
MDTLRPRLSLKQDHIAGWLHPAVVGSVVLLALLVALLLIREIRFVPRTLSTAGAAATGLPTKVVSVATLVLESGRQIHVGDSMPETVARLASQPLVTRTEERGPFGLREVRAYSGFTLVFEPLERAGDARVAAIYVE